MTVVKNKGTSGAMKYGSEDINWDMRGMDKNTFNSLFQFELKYIKTKNYISYIKYYMDLHFILYNV
jgi:hypothetical protein